MLGKAELAVSPCSGRFVIWPAKTIWASLMPEPVATHVDGVSGIANPPQQVRRVLFLWQPTKRPDRDGCVVRIEND